MSDFNITKDGAEPLSAGPAVLHSVITPWGEFSPEEIAEARSACETWSIPVVYAANVADLLREAGATTW